MIFVGGVSGAGKTRMLEQLTIGHPEIEHVRASSLLRSIGRSTNAVSIQDLIENQRVLGSWLAHYGPAPSHIRVLDGHGVLLANGTPFKVPLAFFELLAPESIVVITAAPSDLLARRIWPQAWRNADAIQDFQDLEISHLESIGRKLQIPVDRIVSGDLLSLEKSITGRK